MTAWPISHLKCKLILADYSVEICNFRTATTSFHGGKTPKQPIKSGAVQFHDNVVI